MPPHTRRHDNPLELIGHTPMVPIRRLKIPGPERQIRPGVEVWAKLEGVNPGGSIKDRIALSMIETAERAARSRRARSSSRPPAATPASGWRSWPRSRATSSC